MKVAVLYRNDPERSLTDPLPELGGRCFVFRVYAGDFCDKIGGAWLDPNNLPWRIFRTTLRFMPFVAWRWPFTTRGGYGGFKLYGVDSGNYKTFIDPAEVFVGSMACHLSFRPFANLKKEQK